MKSLIFIIHIPYQKNDSKVVVPRKKGKHLPKLLLFFAMWAALFLLELHVLFLVDSDLWLVSFFAVKVEKLL